MQITEETRKSIDKSFKPISERVDELNLKLSLRNVKLQIDDILQRYDKFSKNEMDTEEKIMFANYLINIYNSANKLCNVSICFDIDDKKVESTINLMKSSNIHNKVIGIDNFMALSHTLNALLVSLVLIINNIDYKFGVDYELYWKLSNFRHKLEDTPMDIYYEYDDQSEFEKKNVEYAYYYIQNEITHSFLNRLDYIRERKGLVNLNLSH